jgi:ketosteroid isomerase-like protein
MMKKEMKLPKRVETYIRAINARDADAFQSSFAHDAVVKDVGREIRGIAAIKEWTEAEEAVAEIKAAGGRAIAAQGNVAIVADMERLFKEVLDKTCRDVARPPISARNLKARARDRPCSEASLPGLAGNILLLRKASCLAGGVPVAPTRSAFRRFALARRGCNTRAAISSAPP